MQLPHLVFSALASAITAPISALVAAVLYFRLRAVEGTPEPLASGLDALAPPTVPPAPPAV